MAESTYHTLAICLAAAASGAALTLFVINLCNHRTRVVKDSRAENLEFLPSDETR
jgi:hypothetical protein